MGALLQEFQQLQFMILTQLSRSMTKSYLWSDDVSKIRPIGPHQLHLPKTDSGDSCYSFVIVISYKSEGNCLPHGGTEGARHLDEK